MTRMAKGERELIFLEFNPSPFASPQLPYPKSSFLTRILLANRYDRFVEFETAADLKVAVEKLDNQEFKGNTVRCTPDVSVPLQLDNPGKPPSRKKLLLND